MSDTHETTDAGKTMGADETIGVGKSSGAVDATGPSDATTSGDLPGQGDTRATGQRTGVGDVTAAGDALGPGETSVAGEVSAADDVTGAGQGTGAGVASGDTSGPGDTADEDDAASFETELVASGGCRKRVTVKVAAEAVAEEFDETVRRFSKAVRMPGFRRGKVPAGIVRKRFAHEIEEEVREHLVRHGLTAAFRRHGARPLHDPVIEAGEVKEAEAYSFSALFEVKPEIPLGEYRGLQVSVPAPDVTEEDIDQAIDSVREGLAKFIPVEPRPIEKGDHVLVDLEGRFEDGKGKDFKHEEVMIEVGAENNLPEFNAALPAATVGQQRTISVSYPGDFGAEHLAGRQVAYTLTIRGIKRRELPAADDELPKDIGKSGTLADFREEVRNDLLAARKWGSERQARELLLRQLVERYRVEVPEVLVEEQVNHQIEDRIREMIQRGIQPSKTDIDWNEVREKEIPLAASRVLGMLILEEIAAREGISVGEGEMRGRIAEEARKAGKRSAEVEKSLADPGSRQALKNQIVREKSLDFLLKNATITP